jgi:nicotinate-nucleotide adenylyltransferase
MRGPHVSVGTPVALAGQRIGLMGGTFDPAHAGHVLVAETALKRLELDVLWWIVSPGNPLKDTRALTPQAERIAAVAKLVEDPRIHVTGFEADLGSAYTIDTLSFLKRRFPATKFVWVMGADNLAGFARWRRWRDIALAMPMAIVDRPGYRMKALASPAGRALERHRLPETAAATLTDERPPAWVFLTVPLSHLSSTALRARAKSGTAKNEAPLSRVRGLKERPAND